MKPADRALALSGAPIGLVAAFFGIGGGILIVPVLVALRRAAPAAAAGTSLGVIACVAGMGVASDLVFGTPASAPALLAVLCVAPTAILCSRAMARRAAGFDPVFLRRLFACVLLAGAARLVLRDEVALLGEGGVFEYARLDLWVVAILLVVGLCVGTISPLVGIGGGLILIPALELLFADLDVARCRSTSLLVVLPTAFVGFARHLERGNADLAAVRILAPGCMIGAVAGSFLAQTLDARVLSPAFGALLAAVGVKLLAARRR